jgi:hypothetical protein
MNKVWTETEELFIREHADKLTDKDGAKQLGDIVGRPISINAWRKKRQKLGLAKAPGRSVCKLVRPQE